MLCSWAMITILTLFLHALKAKQIQEFLKYSERNSVAFHCVHILRKEHFCAIWEFCASKWLVPSWNDIETNKSYGQRAHKSTAMTTEPIPSILFHTPRYSCSSLGITKAVTALDRDWQLSVVLQSRKPACVLTSVQLRRVDEQAKGVCSHYHTNYDWLKPCETSAEKPPDKLVDFMIPGFILNWNHRLSLLQCS